MMSGNILYESIQYVQWTRDFEVVEQEHESLAITNYGYRMKDFLKSFGTGDLEICKFINLQLAWHIAVPDTKLEFLALLQDELLEIRSKNENYSTLVGQAMVPLDKQSEWRKIEWNAYYNLIVTSTSDGLINGYNIYGDNLFTISMTTAPTKHKSTIPTGAVASLMFVNARTRNTDWLYEIIAINYSGQLYCYQISKANHSKEDHNFIFGNNLSVSAATFDHIHNIMIVAFPLATCSLKDKNFKSGLSTWRLLNDFPYYRLVSPTKEELFSYRCDRNFFNWIPDIFHKRQHSIIVRMRISHEADYLGCLHSCGGISIWFLPSLRLFKIWLLADQLGRNMDELKGGMDLSTLHPIDINWSPLKRLIVIRNNGLICMYDIDKMVNMLEDNSEFLDRRFSISNICDIDKGFLVLERKEKYFDEQDMPNRSLIRALTNEKDEKKAKNELARLSIGQYFFFGVLKYFSYFNSSPIKDKPLKVVQKTYHLHCVKSMSPEELYSRKIDCAEYEDALAFAELYNLDKDHVYQRQWRNNPVSEEAITNCLSKIKNRLWVLHECCERLPESLSAAEYLLNFGLELAEFNVFVEYKNAEQASEILQSPSVHTDQHDVHFTASQLNLLQMRKKLLQYKDRLQIYKMILEKNDQLAYNKDMYDKIRLETPADIAISYAANGNYHAVELLFSYYGNETLPRWLEILSNFPETLSPILYKHLLPKFNENGCIVQLPVKHLRDLDWSEGCNLKCYTRSDSAEDNFVNITTELSKEQVFKWYEDRIRNIEKESGLIEYALELLNLAFTNSVPNLETLYHNLLVLTVLAYELVMDDISLSEIEEKTDLEKLHLLMENSSKETFLADFKIRAIPFLVRCEKLVPDTRSHIMKEYLREISKTNLSLSLILFDYARDSDIFTCLSEKLAMGIECLYATEDTEQTDIGLRLLDTLLSDKRTSSITDDIEVLYQSITDLEFELWGQKLLNLYNIFRSLSYIHENCNDLNIVMGIMQEMVDHKLKKLNSDEDLKQLLDDMITLKRGPFKVIPETDCLNILAFALLTHTNHSYFSKAMLVLSPRPTNDSKLHKMLSYDESVNLVLKAARQHFNSATTYHDKRIRAASICLNLITVKNESIEEELDLIQALNHLQRFGVLMLPFQVRSSENRMRFIDMALEKCHFAYKKTDNLLKLAACLRIFGDNRRLRHSTVIIKSAETAFRVNDYISCATLCKQMVDYNYSSGWEICKNLCECPEFTDVSIKQSLIRFTLIHCGANDILNLVKIRNELEYKILQTNVQEMMTKLQIRNKELKRKDNESECIYEEANQKISDDNTAESVVRLIKSFSLPSSELLSFGFWKNTLGISNQCNEEPTHRKNEDCAKQGFPYFYEGLHSRCGCYISPIENLVKSDEHLQFIFQLFTYYILHIQINGINAVDIGFDPHKIILQIGISLLTEDCYQSLCYLLVLSDIKYSEEFFSELPHTLITKKLALYYYVLKYTFRNKIISSQDIFCYAPLQILTKLYVSSSNSDGDEIEKLITKYKSQIENFHNVTELHELDCGIDINRYFSDNDYRCDSIIGLAMSVERDKLYLALKLAGESNVSISEVVLNHITFLFFNIECSIISERLLDEKFVQIIKENSGLIKERLKESIYDTIFGFNHQLLLLFYTIMSLVSDDTEIFHHLMAKDHMKLLKKVKATSDCIDYKLLTAEPPQIIEAVLPALDADNVSTIVKFVRSLPPVFKNYISQKKIYESLVNKMFNSEVNIISPPMYQLKTFELCSEYFPFMSEEDVFNFVYEAVFSDFSFTHRDVETRKEFLNISIESCRGSNLPSVKAFSTKLVEWEGYFNQLQKIYTSTELFKQDPNLWRSMLFSLFQEEDIKLFLNTCSIDHLVPTHVLQLVTELLLPKQSFA